MIVAVIPLKRLDEAKSRLAGRLTPEERSELVTALARRTISVLEASEGLARIALVTPEDSLAARLGVSALRDVDGLNASLRAAARWSLEEGATGMLILPGDLPFLRPGDVEAMVRDRTPGISIAGTADGGTGALFLVPPDCMTPALGPGSFERHLETAVRAGLPVRIVERDGLRFDLDTPADLDRVQELGGVQTV
jgi:2-phospho-L-lactate guanylyltransferase